MLRRLFICLLAAAAALAAVSSAVALPARLADESDVELREGSGRALVVMRGALIGSLAEGRVEIRDLPGRADTDIQVLGADSIVEGANRTVYEGENLRFRVFRGWWRVDIRGRGIFTSMVGVGTVWLEGEDGRYSLAGSRPRPWPLERTMIRVGTL